MSVTVSEAIQAKSSTRPRPYNSRTWLLLFALLIIGALYAGWYLKRGWIPHDDGSFALGAERVLHGELPHRDFVDLYTGGLSLLNAAALRTLGVNMAAIRYPVYLVFLLWIPAVFNLARRLASDSAAFLVTLLAISFSLPNYSSAVPSWYNLFLATFGLLALFRFMESDRKRWLLLAGACAGLSFVIKVVGLYFLAACLLALVYHEQEVDRRDEQSGGATPFGIFIGVCCTGFVIALIKLSNWNRDPRYWIHFVVPGIALIALLVWREFTGTYAPAAQRFRNLFSWGVLLAAGFAVPVLVFLVPYIASGSLRSWIEGVFVAPGKRLTFASREPASLKWVNLLATAVLTYALLAARSFRPTGRAGKIAIAVLLAAAVIVSGFQKGTYHFLWVALVLLIPVSTVAVAIILRPRHRATADRKNSGTQYLFAVTAAAALCSLIQYPYASPIYLLYALPLIVLVWLAVLTQSGDYSRFLAGAIAIAYLTFFVLRVTPSYVNAMGLMNTGNQQTCSMHLPRAGGIRVEPAQGREYEQVVELIQQHRRGDYIYAAPDAPETYFLAGAQSPSRSLFDFFDEPGNRDQRILDMLSTHKVNVVAIKTPEQTGKSKLGTPGFSSDLDPDLISKLRNLYPQSQTIGHFEVRWAQ